MIDLRKIMISAALSLAMAGCDDPNATIGSTAPTTQPSSAAVPTTQPSRVLAKGNQPTTRPAVVTSSFRIFERQTPDDYGLLYEFPHARLHLKRDENSVVLYSDDPRTAIKPSYSGNSYYLVVPLDKNAPLKLDGYMWHYQAPSIGDHPESAEGIFLDGQRYHLQPSDVTIAFRGEGRKMQVALMGQFLKFDTMAAADGPNGLPVMLKGTFDANVDSEK